MRKNGLIAAALCCALLVGCGAAGPVATGPVVTQAPTQATTQAATEPARELFQVDLTKVSPMILENAEADVVEAAKKDNDKGGD